VLKTLEQASPQAGDALYQELTRVLGPQQQNSASQSQPGPSSGSVDKVAAFKGAKNALMVASRGMIDAVADNVTFGSKWVDFNQIYLQAYNLNVPGSTDASTNSASSTSARSGDTTDLQARANAAVQKIKSRPVNPCSGLSLSDAQAQWQAIKQSAQAMVATYDARVAKMNKFVQDAQRIITIDGPKKIDEARAKRDQAMQQEAERLVNEANTLKQAAQQELKSLADNQSVAGAFRGIASGST
jgi:hypothetical protein